jgi:hypothetical protein
MYLVICKSKLYELFSHNARCKHVHQPMCFKACKHVSSASEHFLVENILEHYGKGVQELASL